MKSMVIILLVGILSTTQVSAVIGQDLIEGIIKINIGNKNKNIEGSKNKNVESTKRDDPDKASELYHLSRQIRQLELAVVQLQQQVFGLKLENRLIYEESKKKKKEKEFTYYIDTPFHGTHYGKGTSSAEAKAKTLQRCKEAGGGRIWCKEAYLKTGVE